MAPSKTLNLQLRGNVVDLVQHHNWLLIAAHHSEDLNLGIQIAPIHNLTSRISTERWVLDTPKSIRRFVSLPNLPAQEQTFVVGATSLDVGVLNDALLKSSAIRQTLQHENRKLSKGSGSQGLTVEQKVVVVQRELGLTKSVVSTEVIQQTLAYIVSIVEDPNTCQEVKRTLDQTHDELTFGTSSQVGQRIVCVDVDGQGYLVPYIPAESSFDGNVEDLVLSPFTMTDKIEFIEALAHHLVMMVVRRQDDSQWVYAYDLDRTKIVFEMPVPQPYRQEEEEGQPSSEPESLRNITTLATDVSEHRFALGFQDGLYLWFNPVRTETGELTFERQELRNTSKQVMTSDQIKKQVNHTGAIVGLEFSNDFESNKPHLTAFCDDLTTSRIQLRENMPRKIAKASSNAHSKRVQQIVKGPGDHFYTLSKDNTLRMWQTANDLSSSISLQATCVASTMIPVQDRHGKWSYRHFLVCGHDGEKVSGHKKLDSAVVSFLEIEMSNMDPTERTGKVGTSTQRAYHGVWSYASQQMKASPTEREALLEYLGTMNDQVAVDVLVQFVCNEENPVFVARALELLNRSNHPRLIILFTELMEVKRSSTCLQVLDYLRMDHLYGVKSLYPLDLANQSSFLEVRQSALRGFAELAAQRGQGNEDDNTVFQIAFERLLGLFKNDDEEDIVSNTFDLLFGQSQPLMPGIDGVLLALAHSQFWVQRRALMLIYLKGMIEDAETKNTALDLLRQMRESSNEELRVLSFRLSLFAEEDVQQYLRSLDEVLHNQLNDLETERSLFLYGEDKRDFSINTTVEQLFLDAVPEEQRAEKEVDMNEAESIVSALETMLSASKKSNHTVWSQQLNTLSYCIQTFPMTERVKQFLLESRVALEYPAPQSNKELTIAGKLLLQEMALSYQPSIAALGAMALARQGDNSALPILLQLVDDKDDLVKSRAVDGLLEFIDEPIVEHKLRLLVLQATPAHWNTVERSEDKTSHIRKVARENEYRITTSVVSQIVEWIFEDGVYSHSERLAVRYLFESVEVSFTSDARTSLFQQLRERGERPKLVNIRAKILRALYKKAGSEGDVAIQHLLAQTLDSPFDDVRMMAVVRLQKRIDDLIESAEDWTKWPRFTAETWSEYVSQQGGGLISATDTATLQVKSPVNPTTPLIGIPKPLLTEVQLLNRILFWRGHEALSEWIKTYCKHNLIEGDFIATRRFLLSLPIDEVYTYLLQEIDRNVQDTMVRGDESATRWHDTMWGDYLSHPEETNRQWATKFYETVDKTMRTKRTSDEEGEKEKRIPPYAPFVQAVFQSEHKSLRLKALQQMLQFFQEEWVCEAIDKSFDSEDLDLRSEAVSKKALWILHTRGALQKALLHMLQSSHEDMLLTALETLFHSTDEDVQSWTKGMIDDTVINVVLARMKEVWSEQSWIDAGFVHQHFVNTGIFSKIPTSSSGDNPLQEEYFGILKRIFVYETTEDINDELTTHETVERELTTLVHKGNRIQELIKTDSLSDENEQVSFLKIVKDRYADAPEKMGVVFVDQAIPELTLDHAMTVLRSDLETLEKPTPRQDKRFFDALTLVTVAQGTWADEMLKTMMATFDEQLSNESFHVYFTRGVQGDNAESFLSSMIADDHPRLDDVFGMLLTNRYGTRKQLKNVLGMCTHLSRIDIVFEAFEEMSRGSRGGVLDVAEWDALLSSRHTYLRYRALNHFFTHEDRTRRLQYLKDHYQSFIQEPAPHSIPAIVSIADIKQSLDENETKGEWHAFVKNGRALKFQQFEALRKRFPMSPGFIRKILNSDTHLFVSGLDSQTAIELQDACVKLDIAVVFSRTNPLYAEKTQRLWESNMTICLEHIKDTHWTTNESLADKVLDLDSHLQGLSTVLSMDSLRYRALESLGSIAGASNFERMYTYLQNEDVSLKYIVAIALIRSGNVQGLRHHCSNDNQTLAAMITLGHEADVFLEQTIQGVLGIHQMRMANKIWLLQASQQGGKADLMMTMLGTTSSHTSMLISAQLFASMHDQDVFTNRVIELLQLEKIQLTSMPSDIDFRSVDRWQHSMKQLREVYVNHYCVEPDTSQPVVLADLRAAQQKLKDVEAELALAEKAETSDLGSDASQSKKIREAVKKAKDSRQQAKQDVRDIKNELQKKYVTADEWKWFAKRMTANNSRVRYLTAEFVVELLDRDKNREQMLEMQERIEQICVEHSVDYAEFKPLSLNGKVLTEESSVSFGFGSLAGIVRNHRNIRVEYRRKALASLIQLATAHSIPTVSASLSVAFNDPSKQLRRDAFVLALNHQEQLGLSWEMIVQQASNAVSLRNAENAASGSSDVDVLNHLIISELHRAKRQDMLLDLVRNQPHNLGYVALELLLNVETTEQATVLACLSAALESSNHNIRNHLVQKIISELTEVQQYNKQQLIEKSGLDYLNEEPYWDLLVRCLEHGVTEIADGAADYLIEQSKRTEFVLDYVYTQWLESFDASKQRRACTALEQLRPADATEQLLKRAYVNNLTETADIPTIQSTLTSLNQYTLQVCEGLFEKIDATRSNKRFSSDPKHPLFRLAYEVLLRFSGVSSTKAIPRVEILCTLIEVMRRNSHYALLGSLLKEFSSHSVETYLSADLDVQLSELATTLTHKNLLRYRQQALQICITRYLAMTPKLKDLSVSDYQKEPQIDAKWSTSGWAELKSALVTNMDFHDVQMNRKLYLSTYQKMSAMALISTQGYTHDVFKIVNKILEDKQYAITERSNALEALVVTESVNLLGSLQRLLGMGPSGNLSERDVLTHGGVKSSLYDRALGLIGRYHSTDKRDDIFNYLLERLHSTATSRQPAVLTSLWRFKDYSAYQRSLLDVLVANPVHSSVQKTYVDLPKMRDDFTTFHLWFEMVQQLYVAVFGGGIAPNQVKEAEKIRGVIVQELQTTDVNRIYEFYLKHSASENIDLDVQLWKSKVHMFLSSTNREVLKSRLVEYGEKKLWVELMLHGIINAKAQKAQQSIRNAMVASLKNHQLRAQEYPGQENELKLSDIKPLQEVKGSGSFAPRQVEVLLEELLVKRQMLSTDIKEWLQSIFHQNKVGPFFVFTQVCFDGMKPLNWQQEVDAWETVISTEVSSVDFYVDLLNHHLDSEDHILESIIDIVEQRPFTSEEQTTLLRVVTEIRREWGVLQREKNKGARNQDQIARIEKRWNRSIQILAFLDNGQEELMEILQHANTSLQLKESALKVYLQGNPEMYLLSDLYTKYDSLTPMLASYMNLDLLYTVMLEKAQHLTEFKEALIRWTNRLDIVLTGRNDFMNLNWLINHHLPLEGVDVGVVNQFVKATQSNDTAAVNKILVVKSSRASIRLAAMYALISDTLQTHAPLSSMYWATVQQGELLHYVVQHLIEETIFDPDTLDSSLVLALSSAKSSMVRESYANLHKVFSQHRERSSRIDSSRSQRYAKELL